MTYNKNTYRKMAPATSVDNRKPKMAAYISFSNLASLVQKCWHSEISMLQFKNFRIVYGYRHDTNFWTSAFICKKNIFFLTGY